jgi:hypothetical protein
MRREFYASWIALNDLGEKPMEINSSTDKIRESTPKGNHFWRYAALACGALVILSACGCLIFGAGSVGLLTYFGREPENLSVEYSLPYSVMRGEELELLLTLSNTGDSEFMVNDIDLDEAFTDSILDGVIVLWTDPPMERDYSIPGIKTFQYNRAIPAGETRQVTFRLQAVTSGEFGGSIGIYVGALAKTIDYVGITIAQE